MTSEQIRKGALLIAEPSLIGDVSFNRSVVLVADHNKDGSVGFILNKPLEYNIIDLVPDINADFTIYNGGPVEQDNLYFIHNVPHLIQDSIEISDGIYWGGNFELTKELINNGKIKNKNIRFFLGYSGWSGKQLEEELDANSWIIIENEDQNCILEKSSKEFWKQKLEKLGGEYLIWSNAPENPFLN